jgi:hypothetical protein
MFIIMWKASSSCLAVLLTDWSAIPFKSLLGLTLLQAYSSFWELSWFPWPKMQHAAGCFIDFLTDKKMCKSWILPSKRIRTVHKKWHKMLNTVNK